MDLQYQAVRDENILENSHMEDLSDQKVDLTDQKFFTDQ